VQCIGVREKDDASRASLASFAARTCACAAGYCVSFARALAACSDVIESMAARGNGHQFIVPGSARLPRGGVRYFNRPRWVVTGEEITDSSPVAVADAIDIKDK
jgi:hypothetical protein